VAVTAVGIELTAGDGRALRFPAAWLRDSCRCGECRDPVTGQRLLDLAGLPDARVAAAEAGPGTVTVTFTPGGHRAVLSRSWLEASALDGPPPPGPRTEDAKALWQARDLPGLPGAAWDGYRAGDHVRARVLAAVLEHGLAVLRGVPAEPGMVLAVAGTLGYVRETNYGRLFDVRAEPSPANLAFTSREIRPHTDNPYRDPVPTVQLLHCLRDAASGGDTLLIDGFAAAALLRDEDPGSFAVLARTPWPFRYADAVADLRAQAPLIALDPRGRIREVRFNSRSMAPLRGPAADVEAAYAAYVAWARLLRRPQLAVRTRLAPGDCLILDNTRILHARTAFTAPPGAGERHLQGCYADMDGLASTLAVLRRAGGG
jgi:gamma-butyrobetaine dioxygenase